MRFLRIATAARERVRGRPPTSYPQGVKRALFLWVTGQASYEEAAGKAALQIFVTKEYEEDRIVTIDYLQRRIQKGMREAPSSLIDLIDEEAAAKGYDTIGSSRLKALQRTMGASYMPPGKSRTFADPPNRTAVAHGIDYARLARTRKLAAFSRAFEDLMPDDMPISQLAALYDETHQALAELIKPKP